MGQLSSHNGSVHVHSRARSVSGKQEMAVGWDFADLQNQLDEIVKNKAIYLKVATRVSFRGGGGERLPPLGSLSPPLGTGRFAC